MAFRPAARLDNLQVGRLLLEVNQTGAAYGVKAPPELTMLGKTLLNLDQVVRALDPDLDVTATLRERLTTMVRKRLLRAASPGAAFRVLSESKELAEQLPSRLNRILDLMADNKLRLDVDAIDEDELLRGLQKIANRISGGLLLAALVIGAALLMRVQTPFTIFGYPGIAMIFFLLAAGGAFWMLWSILRQDR